MSTRPSKSSKKSKKSKKNVPAEDVVDPHQEQIDQLIREREEIRSKLNLICSKIVANIDPDDYSNEVDLTKQQPSEIPNEHLLSMLDKICHYRVAFLNLYQETDDDEKLPVQRRITQLAIEQPSLFRKRLTSDQRLTFVSRERDMWKENAQTIQIMYATIVDQLETGALNKSNKKTVDILRSHRLNLEDVCLIFTSPSIRSLNEAQKQRAKSKLDQENPKLTSKQISSDLEQPANESSFLSSSIIPLSLNENSENLINQRSPTKRTVFFATEVSIINDDRNEIDHRKLDKDDQSRDKIISPKIVLPLASMIYVDKMDSNLRMYIIKELSKDNYFPGAPSKRSFNYTRNTELFNSYQQFCRSKNQLPEWVTLARLIGIDEPEIEHWSSQNLQYPAGRVITTWCNNTSPPPTVAQLYSLLSANQINRLDLAREIEAMYRV